LSSFKVGDLVKFRENSWWTSRSAGFRKKYSPASLVLVTNNLEESDIFFYGIVCGDGSEAHLWSHDQFDLVQKAV